MGSEVDLLVEKYNDVIDTVDVSLPSTIDPNDVQTDETRVAECMMHLVAAQGALCTMLFHLEEARAALGAYIVLEDEFYDDLEFDDDDDEEEDG